MFSKIVYIVLLKGNIMQGLIVPRIFNLMKKESLLSCNLGSKNLSEKFLYSKCSFDPIKIIYGLKTLFFNHFSLIMGSKDLSERFFYSKCSF